MSSETGSLPPVVPNPGGALEPAQVIGREQLIAECWRTLKSTSVALFAPRRIGKTSVLTRMAAEPPPGFVVVRRDLEGLESPAEFVHVLFEDVEAVLGRWRCTAKRARSHIEKLAIETSHIKLQLQGPGWKRLLDRLFEDLEEQLVKQDQLLVLMWDEVTLFLDDLMRRGRHDEAMSLLDSLRAARQRHPHVRMILTGSIGFDELLRRLQRGHGYRNRPLNDVSKQFVPLLDVDGATRLIAGLLRHAGKTDAPELIEAMLVSSEGHPFVIQLLADKLLQLPQPGAGDVDACLRQLLRPPGDPLDLSHYLERIDKQFDRSGAAVARAVLDTLARSERGQTHAELLAALPQYDAELVRSSIRQLEDDFYLRREHEQLVFMLDLLRRFWQEERGR
jgi:hypothetical protein